MSTSPPGAQSVQGAIQKDILASFVVFLVALPLCMGVAIASGVPVTAGLLSGVIGGIVVGFLSGCPLQVSGPAAGLTIIVFEIGDRLGLENLALVVAVSGILQFISGVTGLGQWFRAVSPAVIRGMLAGIGFLILGGQFHAMFDSKAPGTGAINLARIPDAVHQSWSPLELPDPTIRGLRITLLNQARRLATEQSSLRQKARAVAERHAGGEVVKDPTGADEFPEEAAWDEIGSSQARIAREAEQLATELTAVDPQLGARAAGMVQACRDAADTCSGQDFIEGSAAASRAAVAVESVLTGLKCPQFAGLLGLGTIAVILIWQELTPRSWRMVPPALVAVLVASVAAAWLRLPVYYVDVPDRITTDILLPRTTVLENAPWKLILQNGLLLAVVASAETLLCASAVDQMHRGPRTRYNRELWAQGIGNFLCGLVGALPMTGVIVRSSANVQSGATTRLSAILHGMWLLIFVTCLAGLLRQIPTSCLAAILVYTGYRLIDVRSIRELRVYGWGEVLIYAVTVLVIIFEDLLTGVLAGLALSAAKLLLTFSQLKTEMTIDAQAASAKLTLEGAATFIRLPTLAAALERVPPGVELHVDFERLDYIDHACLELLMSWGARHQESGAELVLDWSTLQGRFRRSERAAQPTGG